MEKNGMKSLVKKELRQIVLKL